MKNEQELVHSLYGAVNYELDADGRVRTLDLVDSKLTSLHPKLFDLQRLETLDLGNNNLRFLPAEISRLQNLQILDLSGNPLRSLPPEIERLQNLQTLNLARSDLGLLPPEAFQLRSLQWLDLSGSLLGALPPEIALLRSLQTLDVSGTPMGGLPLEVYQLPRLRALGLASKNLMDLPPEIAYLQGLQKLDLSSNRLNSFPPAIVELENLQALNLASTGLKSLHRKIVELENLQTLDLGGNGLTSLPSEIFQLQGMQILNLGHNILDSLPPEIGRLQSLQKLNLATNNLTSLPPEIGHLQNLRELNLSGNRLRSLPPEIVQLNCGLYTQQWKIGGGVSLYDNPLTSPPMEIVNQGRDAVIAYFEARALDAERQLNEVKILLVGDGGAGKTSLVKRLCGEGFDQNETQTDGINIAAWAFFDKEHEREILGRFWDFGGQEIMHSTHQFFLSKRSVYMLILDGRRDDNTEYWLKTIESFGGNSPILVVLNKIDENPGFEVNRRQLRRKYPSIVGFYRVSCRDGVGIGDLNEALVKSFDRVEFLQTAYPRSWFETKKRLEEMERPFINEEAYTAICTEKDVSFEARSILVRFLSDLGTVVHFEGFDLQGVYILKPEWVTKGVYTIINSEQLAEGKGQLDLTCLGEILGKEEYPADKHHYLVALMRRFELCYRIDGQERILVPDLLDVSEPEIEISEGPLSFRYEYNEFLPPSIMPRFIVKMHPDILEDHLWRSGVVLRSPGHGCKAIVSVDRQARVISIEVDGDEVVRRDYLAVIQHQFTVIHASFEEINVQERIPLPDQPQITVSPDYLLELILDGTEYYLPPKAQRRYSPWKLLGLIYHESSLKKIEQGVEFLTKDAKDRRVAKIGDLFSLSGTGPSISIGKLLQWWEQRSWDPELRGQ